MTTLVPPPAIPETIYDSPDALASYLDDIRARREHNRAARQKRAFWQEAVARIEVQLAEAEAEGDEPIAAELRVALEGFQARLSALPPEKPAASAHLPFAIAPDVAPTIALLSPTVPSSAIVPKEAAEPPRLAALECGDQAVVQNGASAPIAAAIVPPVSKPESEEIGLSEEERTQFLREWRAEINNLTTQWHTLDADGLTDKNGGINRANAFRLRGLACALGSVYARAYEAYLDRELWPDVSRLRDRLDIARAYANDRWECTPLAEEWWREMQFAPSADGWGELAQAYRQVAEAQEAWLWYSDGSNGDKVGPTTRLTLLNAIGAAQQLLFRALDEFEGYDRLQGDLYGGLLDAGKRADIFLDALHPSRTFAELQAAREALPRCLAAAQKEAEDADARKGKEARKSAALSALCGFTPSAVLSAETLNLDRYRLLPLLDECMAAGVPYTNVQVRNALLEAGPRLLQGQPKYSRFLDAVLIERTRKGLDKPQGEMESPAEPEEEDIADSAVASEKEYVRLFVAGKRLLILGGTPRQHVCEKLREMLGGVEARWPDSKKSDRAFRFQTEINKADILLLVKNFASHDMSEKGREWIRANGGEFLLLPGGYGPNQIIHQLYEYATARDKSP